MTRSTLDTGWTDSHGPESPAAAPVVSPEPVVCTMCGGDPYDAQSGMMSPTCNGSCMIDPRQPCNLGHVLHRYAPDEIECANCRGPLTVRCPYPSPWACGSH